MIYFDRVDVVKNGEKIAEISTFLAQNGLRLDDQIDTFLVAYNPQHRIIACSGLALNIIKCVAIDPEYQGSGIALQLVTDLIKLAYELGRTHLFIYTKPQYETLFKQCGFYTIATAYPDVVLLEDSATRLKKQCQKWATQRVQGKVIGAIVLNANPFTLGHRHLIEQARRQSDWLHLFVVGEDVSQFAYTDRFNLVKLGIRDLDRITLHSGSDYIISRATFPHYFLKDRGIANDLYLKLDLALFRQHIAPALGITHRFIGSEPFCAVTAEYNRKMHSILQHEIMDSPPITVVELDRGIKAGLPISASRVRTLLTQRKWDDISQLVPPHTLEFLHQKYAEPLIATR